MSTRKRLRRLPHTVRHRWAHLTGHPLTRERPLSAVARYLRFHLGQIRPHWVRVPYVDGTHLVARRGVGGATDHLFVHLGDDEELALLFHLLRPGDLFADVGANVGAYTILAAATGADVLACEPGEAVDVLLQVIDSNGFTDRVEVEEAAVGAAPGSVSMTRGADSLNRVLPDETGTTPLTSVDVLTADRRPLAMKVDVEGYEIEVLAGAQAALADPTLRVMILELNGSGRPYGVSDADVHAQAIANGFQAVRYDARIRRLRTQDGWNRDRFNTIYVRDRGFVEHRVTEARTLAVGPHRL